MKTDILVEIDFSLKQAAKSVIKTNAVDKNAVEELLGEFLRTQLGQGRDGKKANEKDAYKISIGLDLSGDVFQTVSDTGNQGLTAGIVSWVLQNIDGLSLQNLDGTKKLSKKK